MFRTSACLALSCIFCILAANPIQAQTTNSAARAAINGTLVDAQDKPVANADVQLLTRPANLVDGRLIGNAIQQAKTDSAGKFAFGPQQTRTFLLIAMTEAGYVFAEGKDIGESARLRLAPWSRLEGTLTLGDKPAPAGLPVEAQFGLDDHQLSVWFNTKTDASGRFTFERVFSQTYDVSRARGEARKRMTISPGTTGRVDLRSVYSPVTARIALPSNYDPATGEIVAYTFRLPVQLPSARLPDGVLTMSPEQRLAWFDDWMKSPAGQLHAGSQANVEASDRDIDIKRDGTFRIADVPPGTYNLHARFQGRVNGSIDFNNAIAGATYKVTIPQTPYQDSPIDLGVLPLFPDGWADSQSMQDIVIPILDGKEVLLSSFKGKVVLLDFWGVWCGVCTTNLPHIQALYDRFGSDPNFAIISLSVDDEPAQIREFLKQHRKPWTIGVLGPRDKAWATKLYSVMGYPTYWLIGADGKVIATGNTTNFLAPFVSDALNAANRR